MKFSYSLIVLSMLVGCHSNEESQENFLPKENDSLRKEISNLTREIKEIKSLISAKQKQVVNPLPSIESENRKLAKKEILQQKQFEPIKPIPKKELLSKMDDLRKEKTLLYKNSSSKAIYFSTWKEDRQDIILFDLKGNETYRLENVQMSYSIRTEIKSFHPSGAVNQVSIHTNPGASMFMYESIITFSDQNEPLTKEDFTSPARLEDYMNNVSTWNKEKKQWEKPN